MWANRPLSAHKKYDNELKDVIRELHQGYRRAYGAARLHRELIHRGYPCSRRRINRLMREMGVKASTTGLYVWNPGKHAFYSATGNQLKEAGPPSTLRAQWAGDFTYIKTQKGLLFHAIVMDIYSRRIIGWSFSRTRNAELTKSALKMALEDSQPRPDCIFHSDQGIEYAAHEYRDMVESAGLQRSMSRKATPQDNATVESYFHTMKAEMAFRFPFRDEFEAVAYIREYTEFYNRERLHSALDYQSPANYEKLCA
jgi:transposase InsO family protein